MAKKRYKFNPQTLTYEVIAIPLRIRFYRILRKILVGFILASIANLLFSFFFYTPKMYRISERNNELMLQYEMLGDKIRAATAKLDELRHRDNRVYRSLFGLKPVRGRILHTPRYEPVDTVLDLIKACRGVVVLAHPSVYHSMELARELIAAGRLDGVEIDHPRNTPEDKTELLRLAKENGLLITGGTDYHGIHTVTPRPVGAFATHDEQIARLNDLAKARKSTFKRTT